MSRILIKNGTIVLPDALLKKSSVLIEGGKIIDVGGKTRLRKADGFIDAKGCFVAPGFIDTHIHGSPDTIFKNEIGSGTTSIVIAGSCASPDELSRKLRYIEKFKKECLLGRNILGFRLEGPYISKEKAGAQDKRWISKPDMEEARKIAGKFTPLLKIMTIAPEIKGAIPVIKLLKRRGITVSLGHTNATYDEAVKGIDAGIDHATHAFNAMRGIDKNDPGAVGAVLLNDAVTAEIILDLIHVKKALFDLLVKVKGRERVILVTDSVRAEHSRPVRDVYRLPDGTIAGSSLTMIKAVANAVRACGLSLVDAARLATLNPARFMGIEKKKGRIAPGTDADIVIFDKKFDVKITIIDGMVVYDKRFTHDASRFTKRELERKSCAG